MNLSIIIPVYNEEKTILVVLKRLSQLDLPNVSTEVIVVNDGSTDSSKSLVADFKSSKLSLKIFNHSINSGKGAAIQTGIQHSKGEYILIQDADLEYNPKDIPKLFKPILDGKVKVVYGTRLNRLPNLQTDERTFQFLLHYAGNRFLSFLTSVLYGQWITDMETCYKVFPKSAIVDSNLTARGFDFEPEITSLLLKNGYKILEIPISTNPRGYDEGKKLNTFRDGFIALWTLLKLRFIN